MSSTAFFQFWSIALNPTIDRRMIHQDPSLSHEFFHITITQNIAQVPTQAEQNNVGLEVTPFEGILFGHD
jgi:hypothetical protein